MGHAAVNNLIREVFSFFQKEGGIERLRCVRQTDGAENLPEGAASLAEEPGATWFMDYYNSDGSTAEMCGNGTRVFARYLTEKGLVDLPEGETLSIGTRAGVKDIQRNLAGFVVDLGRWKLEDEVLVKAHNLEVPRPGQGINVGNPHVVVALAEPKELATLDLTGPARELRISGRSPFRVEFSAFECLQPKTANTSV